MTGIRARNLILILILIVLGLLPWLISRSNPTVPPEIIAQPTAYLIKRQAQQTATAQADVNAAPTLAATAFDIFNQPETTPDVLAAETPQP